MPVINPIVTEVDILTIARDKIERDGFRKGQLGGIMGDGPVCALGALYYATNLIEDELSVTPWDELTAEDQSIYRSKYGSLTVARSLAERCLQDAIGQNYIAGWNDWLFRTKRQVIVAFDRAIQIATRI